MLEEQKGHFGLHMGSMSNFGCMDIRQFTEIGSRVLGLCRIERCCYIDQTFPYHPHQARQIRIVYNCTIYAALTKSVFVDPTSPNSRIIHGYKFLMYGQVVNIICSKVVNQQSMSGMSSMP